MPELRMPDFSRRTLMPMVLVMAGVVAMLVALLSGSSSPNSDNPRQSSNRTAVKPVAPIDPDDVEQQPPAPEGQTLNVADPFAVSFGKSSRRKVTVEVTGNGPVNIQTSYRDAKKPKQRVVAGAYSRTRTLRGRFPMAAVVIQLSGLPGSASSATCTITIDGVKVSTATTKKAGAVTFCIG